MILGITGTNGAGKGTVVDYLVQEKGYAHYSVREFLIEEIQKRGLPVNRDTTREVATSIRAAHQPSYIVEILYQRAVEAGGNALIESIRAVGEMEFLKNHGAKIIAVDADRQRRYERSIARGSELDQVDFETWAAQEEKELASTDPNGMSVNRVVQMADCRLANDGTLQELHAKIEEMLKTLAA